MSLRYLPHKAWLIAGFLVVARCGCSTDETAMDMSMDQDMRMPEEPDLAMPDLAPPLRTPPTVTPGAANRILLRGTLLTPTGPMVGEVLVESTNITCVAADCSTQAGAAGATIITTSGIIMPGMLDSHNHGLFNIFDEADWPSTQFYMNHNQWGSNVRYSQTLDAKQYLAGEMGSPIDFRCEMDKYAEMKAMIAGTTSFLLAGGATNLACYASMIRTLDVTGNDLGQDKLRTSISVPDNAGAMSVCNAYTAGTCNAYVVHVGEGIDNTARNEFTTLEGRNGGCLMDSRTTIVHGTAFTTAEFTKMATAKMKLVWSPKSNVFLYNDTAKLDLAIAAGVETIALAPDWALGGSVNLLDELRFARQWSDTKWPGLLSAKRLVDMVTIDAAKVLGVDNLLGSLTVGKRADIVLLSGNPNQPYDSVIAAKPTDIELVMVDGRALYGDAVLKSVGPTAPGCEDLPICNVNKFACVAESSNLNKLDQTYATVLQTLQTELASYDAMVSGMGITGFTPIAPLTKCP